MYICICHAVTEDDILGAVDAGARCARTIAAATRAGSGCGSCLDRVEDLVDGVISGCPRRILAASA